jgi:hypothetical protein
MNFKYTYNKIQYMHPFLGTQTITINDVNEHTHSKFIRWIEGEKNHITKFLSIVLLVNTRYLQLILKVTLDV